METSQNLEGKHFEKSYTSKPAILSEKNSAVRAQL